MEIIMKKTNGDHLGFPPYSCLISSKYSNEDHGSISPPQSQFSLTSVSVLRSTLEGYWKRPRGWSNGGDNVNHEEVGSGASFCSPAWDTPRIRSTFLAHDLKRKKKWVQRRYWECHRVFTDVHVDLLIWREFDLLESGIHWSSKCLPPNSGERRIGSKLGLSRRDSVLH